jgi:imidazolonepropionase
MRADVILTTRGELFTCAGPAPRIGAAQADAGRIEGGVIAADGGRVVFVGSEREFAGAVEPTDEARVIDAGDRAIVPGFVDAHTHVVYAGDRRDELRRRLAGATYGEIAATGGGIVSTVARTRAASEDELVEATLPRLREMLAAGTTTAEVKSGYGLTLEAEMRMLRAIARLDRDQPIDLVPTFMGAHEIPPELRHDRGAYIRLVIDRMIPAVSEAGLAQFCDVFCETGVFGVHESREILDAGLRHGLRPRVHADELGASGGAQLAAAVRARSADHLVHVTREGADALARAKVAATLLPAASFFLKLGGFAPARMLMEAGVPVALGTDVNPGGGFSPSMPFAMALACFSMQLTFEEALVAATINAAWSVGREDVAGSLEVGKPLDAVVVNGPAIDLLRIGAPAIRTVLKNGHEMGTVPLFLRRL